MKTLLLAVVGALCSLGTAWAQVAFDENKVYTINLNTAKSDLAPATTYLNDDGSGTVKVGDFVNANSFKWKFVPGDTEGTYYVQNVETQQYLQSSVGDVNASVQVKMGAEPVAYVIGKDETENALTKGYYYLCSNDQTVNNATDGTTGLNYRNASKNVVCYWIKTGRGNSYWNIQEYKEEPAMYTISLNPDKSNIAPQTVYIADESTGLMTATTYATADKYHWYLEPTGNEDCYYIKNVATGNYMQSSKNLSTQLTLGTEPVEYKIGKDLTEGSGTTGYSYLCSTDQTVDNATDGTLGLNYEKEGNKVIGFYIKSGRGNSYWEVKKVGEETETDEPLKPVTDGVFSADKYYAINRMNMDGAFMVENNAGLLYTTTFNDKERVFWKLIPTGKENCYYVQNATTGRYVQSTKQNASAQIPMGSTPVEIQIGKDTQAGATTNGASFYYFCSTDQSNIPSGALGLNLNGSQAGANVVAWSAASGSQNSYWTVSETEYTYEPQIVPLVESMDDINEASKYALVAQNGQWIAAENGTLALTEKGTDVEFAWAFVGTSNKNEGIYLVNMSDPTKVLTVNTDGTYGFADPENGTRWFAAEKETAEGTTVLTFVPYAQKDEADVSYLTVGGVSEFVLGNYRNAYSLTAQVYSLPCGVLDQGYLTKLDIAGEQVLKELNYAASAKPSDYYNLYTVEKATVARGENFNLTATVANMDENITAYVYFDWNRDGLFETAYSYDKDQIEAEIAVPDDAVLGKSRMRVRITNNGLSDAEDDAVGSIYDFIVNIAEPQEKRTITVQPNDPERGTAEILVGEEPVQSYACGYGEEVTVSAVPVGRLEFISWKDNRTVVSTEREYTFTVTENADLVACFSPNSTLSTDIQGMNVAQNNFVYEIVQGAQDIQVVTDADVKMVYVFAADGTQVRKSTGKKVSVAGLSQGTYIIKVITSAGGGSKKISLK